MATIISIIFAILFTLYLEASTVVGYLPIISLVTGTLFVLITPLIKGFTLLSLQAATVETSSQIMRLVRKDPLLIMASLIWISFAIFSFFVAVFSTNWLFIPWAIWFGVSLDVIYFYAWRITGYLDPEHLIGIFLRNGYGQFSEDQHQELCTTFGGLAEISLKGVYQRSLPLSIDSIVASEILAEQYLRGKAKGGDAANVSYTLGFMLHRFQMIFDLAVEDRTEPLANQVVLSTSKLIMAVSHYDPALSSLPLHFLENFVQKARDHELREVVLNSSIVLFEVARSMLMDADLREKDIGIPLVGIIEQMENLSKEEFKEDKTTPISLLTEPFRDLKSLIQDELPSFASSPRVVAELDRVLVEFQALESVLQTVPNIPGYSEQESQD